MKGLAPRTPTPKQCRARELWRRSRRPRSGGDGGAVMADEEDARPAAESALVLGRRWIAAVNGRDAAALQGLLAPEFTYTGMARTPPELGVHWDRDTFVDMDVKGGANMRRPVIMTIVSELDAGDRAVLETEGYGERPD